MTKITLNRVDIAEMQKVLLKFNIDHFTLIKNDSSGIGYALDIEYETTMNDCMVTVRVPVVGVENW
jgi:hypothetical protein